MKTMTKSVRIAQQSPLWVSGKKGRILTVGILAIIAIVAVVAVMADALLLNAEITQVQVRVSYNNAWQGVYDDGANANGWNGNGAKTITLKMPSNSNGIWIVSANARILSGSSDTLTISILKMDGTVLQSASTTSPYRIAQVSATVNG